MSSKSAPREVRQALADFELGLRRFAAGMASICDATERVDAAPMVGALATRKPMKRTASAATAPAAEAIRASSKRS